jgi:unsaturated rhamnogalacturonyl hydrolase
MIEEVRAGRGSAIAALPARRLAARLAEAVAARRPPAPAPCGRDDGYLAWAMDRVGRALGSPEPRAWADRALEQLVDDEGRVRGIAMDTGDLGRLQAGLLLASRCVEAGDGRLRRALGALREALLRQPRTRAGGFWSGRDRPFQMWLDAISAPFHARCVAALGEPELSEELEDAVHQLIVAERCARDPRTGLPVHAWDESRRQLWSNPESGRSATLWTRGIGWFLASAVDTFDALPPGHQGREELAAMTTRVAAAALRWQDPATGLWWQVADQPGCEGNFPEPSGSCMLAFALARGWRAGCVRDPQAPRAAGRAVAGVQASFIQEDAQGRPVLAGSSLPVQLGGTPYRDSTFATYVRSGTATDEPGGVAALLLALLEAGDR